MKTRSNVRKLSPDEIEEFLRSQRVGTLSMNDGDKSYAVPLAYFYDGGQIYLTIGGEGQENDLHQEKSKCLFCRVLDSTRFRLEKNVLEVGGLRWCYCTLTDPEGITKAVRTAEKHLEMPEGSLGQNA